MKMKRAILGAFFIGIAIVSLFTSCNRQQQQTTRAVGTTGTADSAPPVTVRLLTDATGIDDRSFNAAAWRGILEFYGDTWNNTRLRGRAYDVITAQTQDMYIPNLMMATDHQYDFIVTAGFTWADSIREVAGRNPQQRYMIIDVDWIGLPNVLETVFAEHEGSYLVGVAAALKAKEDGIANPQFGFVGGMPGAVITRFQVGFVQGVLSVLPDAEIVDFYVNSWGNPALAKTQARIWYDSGVYAIFSAAGASGNGVISQAREYRLEGRNVWAVGVDSDQHEEGIYRDGYSAVLTSMVKRVETSVLYGLNAVRNGNFSGGVLRFGLDADGVGYTTTNNALTPDIIAQMEDARRKIISGEVRVAATHAEARQLPNFPQHLRALDD